MNEGQIMGKAMNKRYCFRLVVILSVFFCGFLGLLCSEYRANSLLKSEVKDLRVQLAESRQRADTFYIRDSIPVYKERIVEVDRTDYKKLLADRELIKQLELRVAQVEAENRLLMGTRDTVVLVEVSTGKPSSADGGGEQEGGVLRYHDQWADFAYYEEKRKLEYEVRDSLTTFIAREYKHRFLWLRWGTKGYSVYHVNHNPRSRIYYNKHIRVKE